MHTYIDGEKLRLASSFHKCAQWLGLRLGKAGSREFGSSLLHGWEEPCYQDHRLLPLWIQVSRKLELGVRTRQKTQVPVIQDTRMSVTCWMLCHISLSYLIILKIILLDFGCLKSDWQHCSFFFSRECIFKSFKIYIFPFLRIPKNILMYLRKLSNFLTKIWFLDTPLNIFKGKQLFDGKETTASLSRPGKPRSCSGLWWHQLFLDTKARHCS